MGLVHRNVGVSLSVPVSLTLYTLVVQTIPLASAMKQLNWSERQTGSTPSSVDWSDLSQSVSTFSSRAVTPFVRKGDLIYIPE
jgi:hypothetical protein